MAYRDFKDLPRITASYKILLAVLLIQLKIQNMMAINVEWLQWFTIFLIKGLRLHMQINLPQKKREEIISEKQQLADKLHKPIIRKFKKRIIYSSFKDNIWVTDLADTQI